MGRIIFGRQVLLGLSVAALAGAGCKKLPPPTPLSELNGQQVRGYQSFQAHCAQCHNDRVSQPLNGPSLRGVFKKQYLNSGAPANDERVMDAVLFGRANMPAMGNKLTPEEREDLLAYLHTL